MNDPAPDRDIASVWSALRRRKVVQWTLAYVAGALAADAGHRLLHNHSELAGAGLLAAALGLLIGLPIGTLVAWSPDEYSVSSRALLIVALLFAVTQCLPWLRMCVRCV